MKRKRIRILILQWFAMFRPGDQFLSDDVCKFVIKYYKISDRGSIKRYMRGLRQEGKINYNCAYKAEKILKVIPEGAGHSQ